MNNTQSIIQKDAVIAGKYTVLLFIKKGSNAETYRVRGADGKLYFLKLFNPAKLHRTAFDAQGNLLEIEFLKKAKHENLVAYKESGEVIVEGKKHLYLVLHFIPGETLAERMARKTISTVFDIRQILSGVLRGLEYLHSLPDPIIHNEITPLNIMLDLSGDYPQAKIIDFGYSRSFLQSSKTYNREGLDLNFVASECITAGTFSPQSDLFSVGVVMYQMLFGTSPWNSANTEKLLQQRERPLLFPEIYGRMVDFDDSVLKIIAKAVHTDTEKRFQSAKEFLQALNGEMAIEDTPSPSQKKAENVSPSERSKGTFGFAAIAGMTELKAQLQLDVIDALRNPEEYERYGVSLPNGMLLYGPPGCGKTFFAKRFAEEVGFNFVLATPSTLKSRYINATQENIAKMFREAEENAPTIIFIDEINELLPNRDSEAHEMAKSAVNEMLAQMDRTGEKGIFIIGATNYPDMIDPAMLRAGRLDKKFYLPPPDHEARKAMFEMYLNKRPLDFGIDYNQLAALTEHYVSADIELLVNEAARLALKTKSRISMNTLEIVIRNTKPSVPLHELQKYDEIKRKMEGEIPPKQERKPIGFKQ
ncbi:MAG: AAA family ATPase [Bacteroidales bacterium]|jgi:transitional endoplasmic reticulum ATPase|nr:AAA family ATPase [Bacteroidales bacterium]